MSIDYHMNEPQTSHDSFCGCQGCKDKVLKESLPRLLNKETNPATIVFLREQIAALELRLALRDKNQNTPQLH